MRRPNVAIIWLTIVGFMTSSSLAVAQQKTATASRNEWPRQQSCQSGKRVHGIPAATAAPPLAAPHARTPFYPVDFTIRSDGVCRLNPKMERRVVQVAERYPKPNVIY
jgi:hypothetical protein